MSETIREPRPQWVQDIHPPSRIVRFFYILLRANRLRYLVCRLRWRFLKKNITYLENLNEAVGEKTIEHNFGALSRLQAFGMARRMSLLLYPVAAIFKDKLAQTRILIVGPRTEDDVFWAKSLGLFNTDAIDLFSYSPMIKLADIHCSGIPDQTYDAVLLGWVISYSSNPQLVVNECLRILKPNGLLGVGIESNSRQKYDGIKPPRMNTLNSPEDLIALVKLPIAFNNEPYEDVTYDCGVVFRMPDAGAQ